MNTEHIYPKVLIVSNNSFSETSSNGRTLGGFFKGWPLDSIAQFCISTTEPDYGICNNYFMITDREALNAFVHCRKAKRVSIDCNKGTEGNTIIRGAKKSFKTASKAFLRNMIWGYDRFASKDFKKWITDFSPEVVMIQNSDSAFILKIGMYIAEKTHAHLTMFNTEGFYFFKNDYMREENVLDRLLFPAYHWLYRRTYKNLMSRLELAIYANQLLADDYTREFKHDAKVLYTSSEVVFDENDVNVNKPVFSYLGNFGFDRPRALVEISEVLQSIDASYKLDVYGKYPEKEVEELFERAIGINSKGLVPYSEVKNTIAKSTILFHAEVQDQKHQEGLRYGFSTKIADSIASGHPFVMYSSPKIAGAAYIIETGAGWYAENKAQLKDCITEILTNVEKREEIKVIAREITKTIHNSKANKRQLLLWLQQVCGIK